MGQNRNVQNMKKNRRVAELLIIVNTIPEIRDARVREIKKTVDAGLYRIDALEIADKILEEMRCRCYRK